MVNNRERDQIYRTDRLPTFCLLSIAGMFTLREQFVETMNKNSSKYSSL